jgi:pimeloyl-ACP methyl ester carboxylesterase
LEFSHSTRDIQLCRLCHKPRILRVLLRPIRRWLIFSVLINTRRSFSSNLTLNSVSGYQNQLSIQVEIAKQLAHIVRSGKYPGSIGKPKSLVLVGHSFGSSISAGVAVAEPDLIDGVIMTGMSLILRRCNP